MGNPTLLLTATLAGVAVLASLAGLFSIIRRRRGRKAAEAAEAAEAPAAAAEGESEPLPYRRVEALLTPSERALYSALRPAAVVQGADVFARVRLDDVVEVRKGVPDRQALCAGLAACRVGFLLCDREHLTPLLALEIDGDRARARREEADPGLLSQALAAVGLPLAHVEAHTSYDPEVIAELVRDEIAGASSPPEVAPAAADAPEVAPAAADAPEETESPAQRRMRRGWQVPVTASWLDVESVPDGQAEGGAEDAGEEAAPVDAAAEEAGDALAPEEVEPGEGAETAAPSEAVAEEADTAPVVEAPAESTEATAPAEASDEATETAAPAGASDEATETAAPAGASDKAEETAASAEVLGDEGAPEGDGAQAEAPASDDDSGESRCPACGSALVEMEDAETGVVVLACSRYPECPHVQAR